MDALVPQLVHSLGKLPNIYEVEEMHCWRADLEALQPDPTSCFL